MKRTIVAILLVAALLAPAFGQDVGAPWIDPGKPYASSEDLAAPTLRVALPTSLLAFVSNGIYTDEIDLVARNPLALSQYSGYTLWTLYGNYEFQNSALNTPANLDGTIGKDIKPFKTTTLDDELNNDIGNFQAGIGMPVPFMDSWRLGLLGGTQFTKANRLTGGVSTIDRTDPATLDADADGTVDATTLETIKAKDQTTTGSYRVAAGLDMGFLGASLYAFIEDKTQVAGGSRTSTWTDGGDDTVWANVPTSVQSLYGVGSFGTDAQGTEAKGEAKNWANGSRSLFGVVGQLPLELFKLSTPITARLGFDTYSGSYTDTAMPTRWSTTTGYAVNNDAAKVTTQSWTGVQNISAPWSPAAPGAFVAEPSLVTDPSKSGYGYFGTSLGAWIDPVIKTDGPLTLKTRVGLNYSLGIYNNNVTEKAYSYMSRATTAATNDTWIYSNLSETFNTQSINNLTFDLGALGEFKNADDTIGLGVGLYAKPLVKLSGTTYKPSVTTTSKSWNDQNVANEVTLAGAQANGATSIGTTGFEGSSILMKTTTYSDAAIANELGITMSLPVSAKINFFDKKLSLVGGYVIEFANSVTYAHDPITTDVTTLVIRDTLGAEIFNSANATHNPAITSAAADPVATDSYWNVATNQLWTGTMGFMVRWAPSDNITVDMTGSSIKAAFGALDNFLSLANGIVPSKLWDFVDALALSVTFHF